MILRSVSNKHLLFTPAILNEFFGNKYDKIDEQKFDAFYDTNEAENISGWQRLRNLFQKHEDDIIHPAVTELTQNVGGAAIGGGIYGGIIYSRSAFIHFIENNEATQFRNHLDAKRKLSDTMIKSFLRGFGKWGSKIGIFTAVFTGTQLGLSVYYNKYSFWHYTVGGASAGAIYKFQLGPKGMISGAVFGGCFGTIYGSLKVILLKLINTTEQDLLNFRQSSTLAKEEHNRKLMNKGETHEIQEELKQIMLNPKAHVFKP